MTATGSSNWVRGLVRAPIVQAPMAGGPSRPALAAAVSNAGGLGFLAAGYKPVADMVEEIGATRALTDEPFGVNLFVPNTAPVDECALQQYLTELQRDAAAVGVELGNARWTDDDWQPKLDALLADPVAVVSFAFGCPPADVFAALRHAGSHTIVTVTAAGEAALAEERGADAVCAQGIEAGAHRGGFTDDEARDNYGLLALLGEVRAATALPILAAGAVMDGTDLNAVLAAGATAAQLGTAFLLTPESGAHETYRSALTDPAFETTALTRAFSGRRARGLVNRFMQDHPSAPSAYPQINSATRPLRAEAARRGDAHRVSLWAGQGYRRARALPAGEIVERVASMARR